MPNNSIVVEYLIITKQEDTFCDSDKSFLKFLTVDSSIEISADNKSISINTVKKKNKNKFTVQFSLTSNLVPSGKERYFKMKLFCNDKDKIEEFTDLTSVLEKNVLKLHKDVSINILWNDIGREYAIRGYSLINEVENLLRRLIADFMIINVGYDWAEQHMPTEVMSRDGNTKTDTYTDYLYQTYFSDLKTILFEGQRDVNFRTIGDIQKFVERCISDGKKEVMIDELKGVISKSLWEKYFSKVANTKKEVLERDLENLNKLRNNIAHNRHIKREDLGRIENLSSKITKALNLVIENLPNQVLTPEEQEFQSNTESVRLTRYKHGSNTLRGIEVEQAVFEWYLSQYPSAKSAHLIDSDDDNVDFIIRLDDSAYIGCQVKYISLQNLVDLRNRVAHRIDISDYIPNEIHKYTQLHLIFVVNNYSGSETIAYVKFIAGLIKSVVLPSIKLVFGYIESNVFNEIATS